MVRISLRLILIPAVLLVCGCMGMTPESSPETGDKAAAVADAAREFNREIVTSKGTGWLTLATTAGQERFKLAWAAGAPNRLRLTLLRSGHPVETVAASGEWVTFVSHTGRHKPHSAVSADPDLEPYINIPVRLSEMITILLGRVPIRPFDRAWILPDAPETVVTAKRFSGTRQQIKLDHTGRITQYRLTDTDGNLIYDMAYTAFRETSGFTLPTALTLKDGAGRSLGLKLTTVYPNAEVKESVFRLTASGS